MQSNATFYNNTRCGHYSGPLLTVSLECDATPPETMVNHNNQKKDVYLVVDVSGSMCQSMDTVKRTIFELKNLLGGESPINITLITFNDRASVIFCPYPSETNGEDDQVEYEPLDESISLLRADGSTNMGAGLLHAYVERARHPEIMSWIIVLTDGDSRVGQRTAKDFIELRQQFSPHNTRTIVLGYGVNYKVEICNAVGHFVYVKEEGDILPTVQNIATEIVSSWGFEGVIVTDPPCEAFFGNTNVGPLYPGKKFTYGCRLPGGRNDGATLLEGNISYIDIFTGETRVVPLTISTSDSHTVPSEIERVFYDTARSRILNRIAALTTARQVAVAVEEMKGEVKRWSDVNVKNETIEFLNALKKAGFDTPAHRHLVHSAASAAVAYSSQSDYSPGGSFRGSPGVGSSPLGATSV